MLLLLFWIVNEFFIYMGKSKTIFFAGIFILIGAFASIVLYPDSRNLLVILGPLGGSMVGYGFKSLRGK